MNFIETQGEKIFLFIGFLLVLITGFFSGYLFSQEQTEKQEIVIENPNLSCTEFISSQPEITLGSLIKRGDEQEVSNSEQIMGSFVASKNSTIYHKADCTIVKRIKDENRIFFSSAKEAEDRGFKLHSGE
ncbi:hypothetical protein K0B03_03680 [Patescibacteria group bacterium]|nr:hypothetical protein [Patescibacteria group bacterium]